MKTTILIAPPHYDIVRLGLCSQHRDHADHHDSHYSLTVLDITTPVCVTFNIARLVLLYQRARVNRQCFLLNWLLRVLYPDDVIEVMLRNVSALLPRWTIPDDPLLDRLQQILIVKRLCQELQRACFDRSHRHRNVAVTGEENNRDLDIGLRKFLLQIESA